MDKEYNFDLHPIIRATWESIDTFDKFIAQLDKVCKPNTNLFKSFDTILARAHVELSDYWKTLNNAELTQAERRKKSLERLESLEKLPGMKKFYMEFVDAVNVNRFLAEMKKGAGIRP